MRFLGPLVSDAHGLFARIANMLELSARLIHRRREINKRLRLYTSTQRKSHHGP